MIHIWLYAGRIAVASSYTTLAITDPACAQHLAAPFGALAVSVTFWDWWGDR